MTVANFPSILQKSLNLKKWHESPYRVIVGVAECVVPILTPHQVTVVLMCSVDLGPSGIHREAVACGRLDPSQRLWGVGL